jgi:hypothetical protein
MERGLLWLPLLTLFIWLAWAGWNEYQKIEAYRLWAKDFERHKYDIYAMLGQVGDLLVWCKPKRKLPIELGSISLSEVQQIRLRINDRAFPESEPESANLAEAIAKIKRIKTIAIELMPNPASTTSQTIHRIPFTDVAIAQDWFLYLSKRLSDRRGQI